MKRFFVLVLAVLALRMTDVAAEDATTAADKAAQEWLALVDAGRYADSWSEASQVFKNGVSRADWKNAVESVRAPLGALKSRTLQSADAKTELPGVPKGEYVVLTYRADYEHKSAATETITPARDADGHWRIAGYYIR